MTRGNIRIMRWFFGKFSKPRPKDVQNKKVEFQNTLSSFLVPATIPEVACSLSQTKLSNSSNSFLQAGGVSSRGESHIQLGVPRQDSFSIFSFSGKWVLAAADGVGSSADSHYGSSFVSSNLEKTFRSVFEAGITKNVEDWKSVNAKLSRGLVDLYESRNKNLVVDTTSNLNSRRLAAAANLATTLEILVVDTEFSADQFVSAFHVCIAGDGSIFEGGSGLSAVSTPGKKSSSPTESQFVEALPIHDGLPTIKDFRIKAGGYLALMTDGIGDKVNEGKNWTSWLNETLMKEELSRLDLLKLVSIRDDTLLDDRTILAVRITD